MSNPGDDKRQWKRLRMDGAAEVRSGGKPYPGSITDVSAGGASLGANIGDLSGAAVAVSIDNFGDYDCAVVRQWDDGMAVMFDLAEEDQYSLDEDIESFCRENNLEFD